jgi:hypothetical protein
MLICLGLGAWGVLSGYALFILLREQIQARAPWASLAALVVAAAVTWLIEGLRQRIEPGESKHPHVRLPVMILMLGIFELFVSAWHGVWELRSGELVDAGMVLLGDQLSSRLNARWALAALAALWIIEGAVLAAVLGSTVFNQKVQAGQGLRQAMKPALQNGGIGAAVGAIAGAVGVVIVVLLMRIVAAVHFIATEPGQWLAMVQHAGDSSAWPVWLLFKPVEYLTRLWMWGWWGPILTIVIIIMLYSYARSEKKWWPFGLLVAGTTILIISPLLDNLGTVFLMVFLGAMVWAVPGALLGASVPLLKGPSAQPQFWSVAGFLAAAILGAVAILRGSGPALAIELVACALALLAGVIFWRGGSITANWPLAAMVLALFVAMATWVQHATFEGVLDKLSFLAQQPQQKGAPPPPPSPFDNLRLYGSRRPLSSAAMGMALAPTTAPSTFQPAVAPPPYKLTLTPEPSTAPSSEPWTRSGSLTYKLLHSPPTTSPAGPSQDWTLPHPTLPTPAEWARSLEELSQQFKTIDERQVAADALRKQASQADSERQQAERLLADDHALRDYLGDIKRQLAQLHQRQHELEDAMAYYRKHPLSAAGADPDKWPDRQGAVALLQLDAVERHLTEQAQRIEEMVVRRSPLLSTGQVFELTVTASLAFWVTVGLLIGWNQRQREA